MDEIKKEKKKLSVSRVKNQGKKFNMQLLAAIFILHDRNNQNRCTPLIVSRKKKKNKTKEKEE